MSLKYKEQRYILPATHLLTSPFLECAHAHIFLGASEPRELSWAHFQDRKRCLHYFISLYTTRKAWGTTRKSLLWPALVLCSTKKKIYKKGAMRANEKIGTHSTPHPWRLKFRRVWFLYTHLAHNYYDIFLSAQRSDCTYIVMKKI